MEQQSAIKREGGGERGEEVVTTLEEVITLKDGRRKEGRNGQFVTKIKEEEGLKTMDLRDGTCNSLLVVSAQVRIGRPWLNVDILEKASYYVGKVRTHGCTVTSNCGKTFV